jgi:Protein of unknown function (DUF3703)
MRDENMRSLLEAQLAAFRRARTAREDTAAWDALSRAHIVGQTDMLAHIRVHVMMLAYAVSRANMREVVGQIVRLFLAPLGNVTGRLPLGNSGRSDVSAFQPMPIPSDLRAEINRARGGVVR